MTTIADYAGRDVDLAAYQGMLAGGERLLRMELVGPDHGGRIVAGIQKLAQRFLVLLLTEQGSVPHFPDQGCEFLTDARTGIFQAPLDVFTSFSSALVDIELQLLAAEAPEDPDDERFDSAEVLSVSLNAGNASVRVQVNSRAGTTFDFLAPIPVGV